MGGGGRGGIGSPGMGRGPSMPIAPSMGFRHGYRGGSAYAGWNYGGVGLGYQYGLSGAWMVFTIGLGLLALSVFFSARIARLKVYTVSEMLDLRYGGRAGIISGLVMWAYTLMLAVTSTIAYATIFRKPATSK